MNYYLDTNAVYNINQIPSQKLADCYTSYLAYFELISGINDQKDFQRRQSILRKASNSRIKVVYQTPSQMMHNSFNLGYEIVPYELEALRNLVNVIVEATDFATLQQSIEYNNIDYGISYFNNLDNIIGKNFVEVTQRGYNNYKKILLEGCEPVVINDKTYELSSLPQLVKFMSNSDGRNLFRSAHIQGIAELILNNLSTELTNITIDEVIRSYNGNMDIHTDSTINYDIYRLGAGGTPGTNDLIDLYHLLYVRNNRPTRVVTNDKLFRHISPDLCITIRDFING
ncbi:hypothetical protein [Spirosoma oryzicola]|uniref:hypothetical protein n=1 Tax=Spirosoma oryzicola TaxID=2898794 RepID=UPI001E480DC0|nr:hypothetical protein [Spirosoma oryzicola]UHG93420.1 hypothetical protein LQ777_11060 [Spirosoma oryzicola]